MNTTQKTIIKKKYRFFDTYISKIIKDKTESSGITTNSKQQLNSVLIIISELVYNCTIKLTKISKKRTISVKEVKNALNILLVDKLFVSINNKCQIAIDTYKQNINIKGESRQKKAGIIFSPAVTEKFLRNFGYSNIMVTNLAPVFLACALEYLTNEIIEKAIYYTQINKHKRITIRDLELAVRNNKEINTFFIKNNIVFLGGGEIPFIHPSLLIKKNRKKKSYKLTTQENRPHKFRPGTVSIREIRRFQKISNCLIFSKFPFGNIVRQIVDFHYKSDIKLKISKNVFIILQYFIEQKIVSILRNANFAAIHAGRIKLIPMDIQFVSSILDGRNNPYQNND